MQSKELTAFYKEMQKWIDGGCKKHDVFDVQQGLCSNIEYFVRYNKIFSTNLVEELKAQFAALCLNRALPFNQGLFKMYEEEVRNKTLYNNQHRLCWVKIHSFMGE